VCPDYVQRIYKGVVIGRDTSYFVYKTTHLCW